MKKLLCLAMAAALALSLSSCGGNNEPETTTTEISSSEAFVTETEPETTAPATETIETTEPTSDEAPALTATEAATEGSSKPVTKAEVLEYFNDVINKVKPDSKTIIQNYTFNSQVGELELGKAKSLEWIANKLVDANMGYKEKNMVFTSREDKNANFPVGGMSWSSKLTLDDIKSATCVEKNGVYTITIQPKDDEPSADTVPGYGHCGKALSVVTVSSITANAGDAKNIIKNTKTGQRDAKIVITVNAATGNVTHANYYLTWDLCLTADVTLFSVDLTVSFGLEKDYDIKW